MATALDLLMSTKEDVNLLSEESDICTIDAKTRIIFVPSTIVVGGVQSDKNAERIKFSCPKIVGDNLDLSKFSVRINFENVSSVDFNVSIKDQYICDDVAVDGENVTFSWLIGRNAARYMGTVRFIVCAVKTDSDSNISVEWNTAISEVPVLEGIEIDQPQIGQEEKDVINQLLELTKNTSAEAVQNVNSAKEQAIKDIQSVSQPDTTLTIEGGLAEAKATGEAIGSLKEDIAQNTDELFEKFTDYTTSEGYVNTNGIPITDTKIGYHTSLIPVPPNVKTLRIETDSNILKLPTVCFYSYSDWRNFISSMTLNGTTNSVTIPKGASYFSVNCANIENLQISFGKIHENYHDYIDFRDFLPTSSFTSRTDVSDYLQSAVSYCHENNIKLYIPNKKFKVSKPITVYKNTQIVGDGIYGETKQSEPDIYTIKYTGKDTLFTSIEPSASLTIDGCIFVGNNKSNKCIFINGETSVVKNCTFYSFLNAISVSNTKGSWTGEIKIHDNIFAIGYSGITVARQEGSSSDIGDWEIYNNIFISNSISFECDFVIALKYYNNHDYSKYGIVVHNNSQHFEIFNNYFDNPLTSIRTSFSGQLNTVSNNVFLLHIDGDTKYSAVTTGNNYTKNAFVQLANNIVSGAVGSYSNGAFITISDDFSSDNALTINHFGNSFKSLALGIVNNSSKVTVTNIT
jgi:hypothetical protein